ncbi:MAG: 50S ribosomal protein L29 [Bacteroidales bacterium]|nr:50S ribosomal protein L29 [Bacteroidales bacterium]MBP5724631.1 50S ribosomal protein L29 [Bacteroidales bacterium]MBQ3675860.1 50S ribosomal protein L29 [Bacteroidales bacterium]MBR4690766.1 50S ribosomal protein L29 [Bacteroidales bacterium]
MKATEIRELSTKEIEEKIQVEQDALNKMKLNHVITPLDNPNQIKDAKKTIARLKTILRERELNK